MMWWLLNVNKKPVTRHDWLLSSRYSARISWFMPTTISTSAPAHSNFLFDVYKQRWPTVKLLA